MFLSEETTPHTLELSKRGREEEKLLSRRTKENRAVLPSSGLRRTQKIPKEKKGTCRVPLILATPPSEGKRRRGKGRA